MAVSQVRHAQGRSAHETAGTDLNFLYNKEEVSWHIGDSHAHVNEPVESGVAYENGPSLGEELEQIAATAAGSGNNYYAYSADIWPISSAQAGRSAAVSTDANHGSVDGLFQEQSTTSMGMATPLGSRVRGSRETRRSNHATQEGRGPSLSYHSWIRGENTGPSTLEMWARTYERHESIAYRCEQPPAKKRRPDTKRQ
jgi:hypothetical protein